MDMFRHSNLLFLILLLLSTMLCAAALADEPKWGALLRTADSNLQTEWALKYEHGEGVEQDYFKAVKLYCTAAKRGDVIAQYQLGWLYANGRGVARNDELAAAWFAKAAAQGDVHGKRMLAALGIAKARERARCVLPLPNAGGDRQLAGEFSPERGQVESWVYEIAPHYDLDPALVLAVIAIESAFNAKARSAKNAQGLMQLIPETADRFGVQNSWDPIQNLHGGMAYLRWLLAYFRGDVRLALAGYNAGENAVERYRGIPPYRETQDYVVRIMNIYKHANHPPVEQVVAPSTMLTALEVKRPDKKSSPRRLPEPAYLEEPILSTDESTSSS